jgi:hypothetical protein
MTSSSSARCFRATLAAFAGVVALFASSLAHAQSFFDVRLNTSALIGHPAGPFYLDFQLNDGTGLGNGNNTATLSQFNFGGGSLLGAATSFGGATGSLASSVTLTDTSFFNEFFQGFTPGSSLSFRLSLTNNVNPPTPDLFAFSILDADLFNIRTFSPGNSDALVLVNITGPNLVANAYAGNGAPDQTGATSIALAAPSVTPVPEPSAYGLMGAALVGATAWRRRQISRSRAAVRA